MEPVRVSLHRLMLQSGGWQLLRAFFHPVQEAALRSIYAYICEYYVFIIVNHTNCLTALSVVPG